MKTRTRGQWLFLVFFDIVLPLYAIGVGGYGAYSSRHLLWIPAIGAWWLVVAVGLPFAAAYGYNWLYRRRDEPPRQPKLRQSLVEYLPWELGILAVGIILYHIGIPW